MRSPWLSIILDHGEHTSSKQLKSFSSGSLKIDIGRPSRAVPVTPPCVRNRTRWFDTIKQVDMGLICSCRAFGVVSRHCRFNPFCVSRGITPTFHSEGQFRLNLLVLSLSGHDINVLLASSYRSGLRFITGYWPPNPLCPLLTSARRSGNLTIASVR